MEYNSVQNSGRSTPDSPNGSSSSDSERRSPTSVTAATLVSMSANGHAAHSCSEDKETLSQSNGPAPVRMKRQQIAQACDQCKKLHAKCTDERPCKRCEVNGMADSCSDTPRRYRGRNGKLRTLSLPNPKPAQPKNVDIVPSVAQLTEEPQKQTKPEDIPQKNETITKPNISPATAIPEVPKSTTVVPLPALLPEINALTCPDPLNDDTLFFNTALRPNPRKRIFLHGEDDFDVMHFGFEEDICVDDSSFQWQSLLSPSFTSPKRDSTYENTL